MLVLVMLAIHFGNSVLLVLESTEPSRTFGGTSNGKLEHGKRLPTTGANFQAYSRLGALLGRNSVHDAVRATIVDAYARLQSAQPERQWMYGEMGWPGGGPFWPHRTHENGMSADFMVPVVDEAGTPRLFPTTPWTRFGYDLEFDERGHMAGYQINFEAIARHLDALRETASFHKLTIELVIVALEYVSRLMEAPTGRRLMRLPFMRTKAWVRHDEHYHVDFRLAPR